MAKTLAPAVLASAVLLAGCATPTTDYVPPSSGATAQITVDADRGVFVNKPAYLHTNEICQYSDANLLGFLTFLDGPLLFTHDTVTTTVSTDQPVYLSAPVEYLADVTLSGGLNKFTTLYIQPIFSFTPQQDEAYKVVFSLNDVRLFRVDDAGNEEDISRQGELVSRCEVVTESQGEGIKVFYLTPRS